MDAVNGLLSSGGSSGGGSMMAAGSMFGPWGTAAGAALDLGKAAMGGDPSSTSGLTASNKFDNSGWSVNMGSGSQTTGLALPSWGTPALIIAGLLVWLKLRK